MAITNSSPVTPHTAVWRFAPALSAEGAAHQSLGFQPQDIAPAKVGALKARHIHQRASTMARAFSARLNEANNPGVKTPG